MSTTSVITSHHLSDHHIIMCDLTVGRRKTAAQVRLARNIKAIDRVDFGNRLLHSSILTNPAVTADGFLVQIQTETTVILDTVAPLRRARLHGITPDRKLSSEAVSAKKTRRHLERKWKKSGLEAD